jgi:uncharacterized protein
MKVEVVRAGPREAHSVQLELPPGATVREALAASGLQVEEGQAVGVFGERVTMDQPLAEGDRVEIYRPLAMDPKEARRRRIRGRSPN